MGLTRGKSNRHSKLKNKYANHFAITAQHKAVQKAARKRWLAKRQSLEVRDRMNVAWSKRHPYTVATHTVLRYGLPCPIQTRKKESYSNA